MFSSLRRRVIGPSSSAKNPPPSLVVTEVSESDSSSTPDDVEELKRRLEKSRRETRHSLHVHAVEAKRTIWAKRRFLFPLGIFLGTVLATSAVFPLSPQLMMLMDDLDLSFSIPENLSALSTLEWRQLADNVVTPARSWLTSRDFAVGTQLAEQGYRAKHPVVLIPGVVSTGLESWSTGPEYRGYFRKRLWGTTMIRAVLTEKERWIAALSLDPVTGLDPSPDIKVRAAQGIDAASTFVPGYWIWTKVIENMACLNYDTNNLLLASYDWRLSYGNLEVRDGYFSRLKSAIESFRQRQGKVVLVGHSMGATVVTYFLKWVEAPGYGNGGPDWVENHIEAVISLAGTHLGVAKSVTAFLSGEMKDTVEMNPAGAYVLEKFFSRKERASLFRGWAGSASLWPKGGDAIWGDAAGAPDDPSGSGGNSTFGNFLSFRARSPELHGEDVNTSIDDAGRPVPHIESSPGYDKLPLSAATSYVLEHVPETWQRMMESNYSNGIERDPERLKENDLDPRKWSNPLEIRLPNAPSMKMYCVYGHGKDTERAYWYARGKYDRDIPFADASNPTCLNSTDCSIDDIPPGSGPSTTNMSIPKPDLDMPLLRETWIDTAVAVAEQPKVRNGVKIGEGDGTVSLLSLGAMCVEGWKRPNWNPAGIEIKTIEFPHLPDALDPRGGATTSDHIDILGSTGLNEVVLKVAAGRGHEIEDSFVSPIREYAKKMRWD